ncbi:hypothetical protein ACLKA7_001439 [Drosophila subpalustris]
MDVEPRGQPSDVGGNGCVVSHPQDAPRAEKAPRTQVTLSSLSSRPAPFIIAGLTSLHHIANLVKTVTNSFNFKNIDSSSARLTVADDVAYYKVENLLQSNSIPYNSWQPKEERSYKVVARGMHAETNKQDIIDDLTALNHKGRTPVKSETMSLLRRKRELRHRWKSTRHHFDKAEFNAATSLLWKALFEAKSDYFVDKLRDIDPI